MWTVQNVYDEVCRTLLEDGGLVYVYSQFAFLKDLRACVSEFLQSTGIQKKLCCVPLQFSLSEYDLPVMGMQVVEVFADNEALDQSTGPNLDEDNPGWEAETGSTSEWRQDQLDSNRIEVSPAPDWEGRQFTAGPYTGFYGALSKVENVVDLDLTSNTTPFYGTISEVTGDYYVETEAPFFGTISKLVAADTNLATVVTAQPTDDTYTLTDMLELIPDSFVHYLKYGCLEKVFLTDGESKDIQRASYCRARWREGINIAKAVMAEYVG